MSIEDLSNRGAEVILPAVLSVVEDIGQIFTRGTNLKASLTETMDYLIQALNRSGCSFLIQSPDEETPALILHQNPPDEWAHEIQNIRGKIGRILSQVAKQRQAHEGDTTLGLAAALPLSAEQFQEGIFILYGSQASREELEWLMDVCRTVSRFIHFSRAYDEELNRYKESADIHSTTVTRSDNLDQDEIQLLMIQSVHKLLSSEATSLILIDQDKSNLVVKKTWTEGEEWLYQIIPVVPDSVIMQCMGERKAFLVPDIDSEPHFRLEMDGVRGISVKSLICAPMTANGESFGAIEVVNKRTGTFDRGDQELLASLANSIGTGIYHTRLIQQLQVAYADLASSRWELLRSRNTLRALFDSMPASIYIVDDSYNIIAVNLARAQQVQKHPSALVGKRCHSVLFQSEELCEGCRVSETLSMGNNTQRDVQRRLMGGNPQEFEVSTYPIFDESGKTIQTIVLEQDVTERRYMEAILAQSEKLAAVGQLAAGVAHEINNPMTAIIANAQLLQAELPKGSDLQESIDLIVRAGERANQVLGNLLDFARQEKFEFFPTDVNETIQKALQLSQHERINRSIQLEFLPAEGLPLIKASTDHLQGVWLNMLINAMDAMEDQPGIIRIETKLHEDNIQISIQDSGKGVHPENLSRIFEPFFTTKDPGRGTGLGLAVCHRIIKQHRGHILVDSQLGVGTTFTVVLPIA